ncbi:hypothetical protein [Streptomyces chumphonensis]|uniref:hypothetical protein n=1 Tax=Streptomyces chumphonensis TaxID=1214925 RepID=UPI003D74E468
MITRATRWYWGINSRAWEALRPAFPALLAIIASAALGLWAIGVVTGRNELSIPLSMVGITCLAGIALNRWRR